MTRILVKLAHVTNARIQVTTFVHSLSSANPQQTRDLVLGVERCRQNTFEKMAEIDSRDDIRHHRRSALGVGKTMLKRFSALGAESLTSCFGFVKVILQASGCFLVASAIPEFLYRSLDGQE